MLAGRTGASSSYSSLYITPMLIITNNTIITFTTNYHLFKHHQQHLLLCILPKRSRYCPRLTDGTSHVSHYVCITLARPSPSMMSSPLPVATAVAAAATIEPACQRNGSHCDYFNVGHRVIYVRSCHTFTNGHHDSGPPQQVQCCIPLGI